MKAAVSEDFIFPADSKNSPPKLPRPAGGDVILTEEVSSSCERRQPAGIQRNKKTHKKLSNWKLGIFFSSSVSESTRLCSSTCTFSSSSDGNPAALPLGRSQLFSLSAERTQTQLFLQTRVMQMSVCWRRLTSCLFVTLADGRKQSESLGGGGGGGRGGDGVMEERK